jgi:hypothetical protein
VDEQRFDSVSRTLATTASRRTGLRLLLGTAGAGLLALVRPSAPDAAAHHGALGPGDPCRSSSQCLGADAPLVCDWNGSSLACCTYEGSRCGFDAACCGTALCLGGVCTNQPDYGYGGPGDPCQNASQCVAADVALTCDYVAATDDYRCCALQGDRCGSDAGCCGWLQCYNGRCG